MSRSMAQKVALGLLVALMVFGIGVGALMTWHHDTQLYGAAEEKGELVGCQESATVNCDIVNTSAWSELGGVPIATLSMAAYGAVLVLAITALRGHQGSRAVLAMAGGIAVASSAWLLFVSKSELGYVCAWCIRLYGVNFGILVLSLVGGLPPRPDGKTIGAAAGVLAVLVVAAGLGERVYRSTLSGGAGPEVAAEGVGRSHDPTGPAPERTFTVKTEDGRETTFTLDPDDAWTGAKEGKVGVVMFGDLECGYCKRTSAELARLEATYGDRVLFVFKHFPMDSQCNPGVKNRRHLSACGAARASVCAQEQGVFWAFHDLAYKNQHQLGAAYLKTYAAVAGADPVKFDACLASQRPDAVIRHDSEVGASLDIHGTPRIYIDGKLYRSGSSAEIMARQLELALGTNPAEAGARASAMRDGSATTGPIPEDVPAARSVRFGELAFQIDTFEAAISDGKAVSGKHQIPALGSSWYQADAACTAAGKRMCTEEEWVSACQGARAVDDNHNGELADDMIEGTAYPYGDYHEARRCWDDQTGPDLRPVYTGEMPGCVTAAGVYDLTGNLEEWVGATPETAALLGGAWDTTDDHARCYRRNDAFGAGFATSRTGFRCCAGP